MTNSVLPISENLAEALGTDGARPILDGAEDDVALTGVRLLPPG